MKTIKLIGRCSLACGLVLGVVVWPAWAHPVGESAAHAGQPAVGAVAEPASAASRPASGMYRHRLTAQERADLREKLRRLNP